MRGSQLSGTDKDSANSGHVVAGVEFTGGALCVNAVW